MNRLGQQKHSSANNAMPALIGIGLDNKDGHKRVTQAERFAIVGGSQETHERMTETVVKTFETLDRRGKSIDKVEPNELKDIIKDSTPD